MNFEGFFNSTLCNNKKECFCQLSHGTKLKVTCSTKTGTKFFTAIDVMKDPKLYLDIRQSSTLFLNTINSKIGNHWRHGEL